MWSKNSTLYKFHSPAFPCIQMYYYPLSRQDQAEWEEVSSYFSTYDLMCDVVSDALLMVIETYGSINYSYMWPSRSEMQNHLLGHLPEDLIIDMGTQLLGRSKGITQSEMPSSL